MSSTSASADSFSGSMGNLSFDRFELHINALKSRGISVFPVQLHQDTYLNDPSASSDLYIRAGERVYILVSQKGTYLRVQGKLLRVPYVGTEMNQEQAELFVMSLLQLPSASKEGGGGSGRRSHHPSYPAEQQLPPSSNLLYQKNANHLQITNSRNTSGGDVMMGTSIACSNGTSSSISGSKNNGQNPPSKSPGGLDLSFMNETYSAGGSYQTQHGTKMNTSTTSGMILNSSQSDLQSLSRLAETFCHRSSPYPTVETGNNGKQWSPSPSSSSTSKYDSVATPPVDLEVIKLNRSHSHSSNSNSSNSSNSRTNSPYTRQNWSNLSNDSTNTWANTKDPAFYTDFTITPLSRNNINAPSSPSTHQISSRHSTHQIASASSVALDFASGGVPQVSANNSNGFSDLYRSIPPSASPHQQQQRQVQDSPFHGFGSTNTFETQSPMDLSPVMNTIEISTSPNINLMPRDEQQQSFQDVVTGLAETSRF